MVFFKFLSLSAATEIIVLQNKEMDEKISISNEVVFQMQCRILALAFYATYQNFSTVPLLQKFTQERSKKLNLDLCLYKASSSAFFTKEALIKNITCFKKEMLQKEAEFFSHYIQINAPSIIGSTVLGYINQELQDPKTTQAEVAFIKDYISSFFKPLLQQK